jgi:uncharacterized protein YndB with AHSA1/START domain
VRKLRAAKVQVAYSQYYVQGGQDQEPGDDLIPGLLTGLGPQAVMVITGLQDGRITVTARALAAPPPGVEPDWDVVGETDLESPEGEISVVDWAGPAHPELGPLAISGPGRYRLRVHARHRDGTAREEHLLLLWPSADPAPARLLTELDDCGLELTGDATLHPLDEADQAAAAAVSDLAALLAQPDPPAWSGRHTVVRAETVVPATPRRVWSGPVSHLGLWLGVAGSSDFGPGGSFSVQLAWTPHLAAEGTFLIHERPKRLVLTWSWTTDRVRSGERVPSWPLPVEGPTEIEFQLRADRNGNTAVAVEHRDLPEELAGPMQHFWAWALRALPPWVTDEPLHTPPWAR